MAVVQVSVSESLGQQRRAFDRLYEKGILVQKTLCEMREQTRQTGSPPSGSGTLLSRVIEFQRDIKCYIAECVKLKKLSGVADQELIQQRKERDSQRSIPRHVYPAIGQTMKAGSRRNNH